MEKSPKSLLFDYTTGLAHWFDEDSFDLPDRSQWLPLEDVLAAWRSCWEKGRFEYRDRWRVRYWIDEDLERALVAWNGLLDEIEIKLPEGADTTRLAPLKKEVLDMHSISSFAKAFLSRAERPRFKYIGPGITAFSDETFDELYASEPSVPDQWPRDPDVPIRWAVFRRYVDKSVDEEIITLLFPSGTTVPPQSVLKEQGKADHLGVLRQHMVCGRAGVYVSCSAWSYPVMFVDPFGGIDVFGRQWTPNALGLSDPILSHFLRKWAELVRIGVWDVNGEGVVQADEWYRSPPDVAKINVDASYHFPK